MNINMRHGNYGDSPVLEINDLRKFQNLALLVDRKDFTDDLLKLRPIVLAKTVNLPQPLFVNFVPATPKEAFSILEKYHFTSDLVEAMYSLFVKNKITDSEVDRYVPKVERPDNLPEENISHPSDFRLDKKIKIHRYWYLLYKQNENASNDVYLGYREISKIVGKPYTTIATAINAYQKKLAITIR